MAWVVGSSIAERHYTYQASILRINRAADIMASENRIDRSKVPGNLGKTFADGEEACIIVESSYFKPKMFPKKLIITTRRAIIYKPGFIGKDTDDYQLNFISNVDVKKGLMRSDITIHAGLESCTIEHVSNDDAQRAVRVLKANMQAYGQMQQAPQQNQSIESVDLADQLKKLAELRDQGILSEDEFKEAKRKILDKLGS